MHEWPDEWLRSSDLRNFKIRLTPELSLELAEKIHDLIDNYRGRILGDPEGAAVVRTHLHMLPRRPTERNPVMHPDTYLMLYHLRSAELRQQVAEFRGPRAGLRTQPGRTLVELCLRVLPNGRHRH